MNVADLIFTTAVNLPPDLWRNTARYAGGSRVLLLKE